MKKLVLAAIVAAGASQAAGCIITSDDTSDPVITANITLHNGGPASTIQCVEGDGIRVNARLTGTSSGFSDVYNCDVVALQTPPLTTGFGAYDVWVDYINDRGFPNDPTQWVVVDATDYASVDVQGDLSVDADLTLNHGFFAANWSLTDAGGNPITSCAAIPTQDGVSIISMVAGGTQAADDVFNCEDGFNNPNPVYTDPLILDDYVIATSIINTQGAAIGEAPDQTGSIINGNDYSDLGVLDIVLF